MKALIGLLKAEQWKEPVRGCGYELAETVHCMNQTKKAFRLVIKREVRRQGELFGKEGQYFYHAVATNWLEEEKNTQEVLAWHNQRGQAENFNKELKIGLGMERLPAVDRDALWADPRQCSLFQDRGDCVQSVYWVQTAFLSGVMDETDHSYLSVEDGASGGSDRQACWEDGSEINDGCGKIGIISRDQKKVF